MIDQGVGMLDHERFPARIETRIRFTDAKAQRVSPRNAIEGI